MRLLFDKSIERQILRPILLFINCRVGTFQKLPCMFFFLYIQNNLHIAATGTIYILIVVACQ